MPNLQPTTRRGLESVEEIVQTLPSKITEDGHTAEKPATTVIKDEHHSTNDGEVLQSRTMLPRYQIDSYDREYNNNPSKELNLHFCSSMVHQQGERFWGDKDEEERTAFRDYLSLSLSPPLRKKDIICSYKEHSPFM